MTPFILFLLLVIHSLSSSCADTSFANFAQAATSTHIDTILERPFIATTNILVEAKTLSHFASQRHAEMSAHISNQRYIVSSAPLKNWVEIMRRFVEQVSLHTTSVKQTVTETLEQLQYNEPATYEIQQILKFTENIVQTLHRIKDQNDKDLVVLESEDVVGSSKVMKKQNQTIESRNMHNHWRVMRKEAEHVVHEAKRIKKNLIILKDSMESGNAEL